MIKRWVIACAVLGVLTAPAAERLLQAQPPAAVPAWIPPPAPAPPVTLWRFLGIPQGFQRIGDARLNRNGNFPGLERKPPLKPIAHPDNLQSNNPAIKKAAEIKIQEDLAKQKIKAIKYLAKLGCDKCYGGVKEAMMAALDDCTEQVRYEAAKALGEAAVQHCDVCSRQCCCDEDLTKKLAQIVYEMDDKGCPLESSERVREMAKEALCACCPNEGPPLEPEVIEGETPPPKIDGETPPPAKLEAPPATIPELPPPPMRDGVEPRTNGEVTPRPTLPQETSNRMFLRSRADRMAATSQVRRKPTVQRTPTVQRATTATARMPAARRPTIELPAPQQVAITPPATRLVISDEIRSPPKNDAGARITLSDADADPPLNAIAGDGSTVRIRISDAPVSDEPARDTAEAAAAPQSSGKMSSAVTASDEGTIVRIRDSADDLQLASAQDLAGPDTTTSAVSSRRNQVVVSDLFAPPTSEPVRGAVWPAPPVAASRPASEAVASVESIKTKGASAKVQGRISGIDSRLGTVQFRFNQGEAPATGDMVKVYHQFLLGQECVGALEVVSVRNGVATARPVGSVVLNKLAIRDQVAYQTGGDDSE